MVELHDLDGTGQVVPVRRLPAKRVVLSMYMPLQDLEFGEDKVRVEIYTKVQNGSIIVGIGSKDKNYYIVQIKDIVFAAYQADRARRVDNKTEEGESVKKN